jgi:glycosyltransferase involved in cell wall biosynthesis
VQSTKGHVLLIAYFYPPSSEAGAKRAEGFHRFLPEWGYRSTLITIGPGTSDEAMERNVVRVHRSGYRQGLAKVASRKPSSTVRSLIRLYKEIADVPDGYRGFFAPACSAGLEVAQRDPVNAIIATSTPYTALRVGSALSRRLGVPWIADLRDLWTGSHYGYAYSRVRLLVDKWLERRWLNSAARIVTATRGFSRQLAETGFPSSTIYNGFLEQPTYRPAAPGPFRIAFLGRLYEGVGHSPLPFFEALCQLRRDSTSLFDSVRVEFFGTVNDEFLELRRTLRLEDVVHSMGQVPAARAREEASAADLLLVLLADRPDQEVQVPTKVFDYAATQRPILFLGPEGEGAEIVRDAHLGRTFRATDVAGMARWVGELVSSKKTGASVPWGNAEKVAGFHYRCRAKDLARELDSVIGGGSAFAGRG